MHEDEELKRFIDARLKALPGRRAPETLRSSVMQAVRAGAARPWYARPWAACPAAWRAAAAVALLVAAVSVMSMTSMPALPSVVDPLLAWGAWVMTPVRDVAAAVGTFSTLVEVMGRVIGQSILGVVLALSVAMVAASALIGEAIRRVAFGETGV